MYIHTRERDAFKTSADIYRRSHPIGWLAMNQATHINTCKIKYYFKIHKFRKLANPTSSFSCCVDTLCTYIYSLHRAASYVNCTKKTNLSLHYRTDTITKCAAGFLHKVNRKSVSGLSV